MTARRQSSSTNPVIRRESVRRRVIEVQHRSGSPEHGRRGRPSSSRAAAQRKVQRQRTPARRSQVTEEPRQRRRDEQRGAPETPAAGGAHEGPTWRIGAGVSSKPAFWLWPPLEKTGLTVVCDGLALPSINQPYTRSCSIPRRDILGC